MYGAAPALGGWSSAVPALPPHARCASPAGPPWLLQVVGVQVQPPFQRLTYAEAMDKYASGERCGGWVGQPAFKGVG